MATDRQRARRLAEMDQEIALNKLRENPDRLRQAQRLGDKAEALMQERGIGYVEAVRLAAQEQDSGEPSVAEVERYMRENDVQDFGQAVREVARDQGLVQEPIDNSTVGGASSIADEEAALRARLQERGYELDD